MSTIPQIVDDSSFAWCHDKYQHIWDAVAKLATADPRLGVVIECGEILPAIVMKKAHTYARRFGLDLMCKTRIGAKGPQIFTKRRTSMFRSTANHQLIERKAAIISRLTLGYSSKCSELSHVKCNGKRNCGGRKECSCPCHHKDVQ